MPANDRPSSQPIPALAAMVARIRNNLGIDTAVLSQWTELPPSLLESIEAGTATPTLRELWVLARAFEIPFGILLGGARAATTEFAVLRAGDAAEVRSSDGRFRSRALLVTEDPHEPEVYQLTLLPGCLEQAQPHAHGTFEHITVVSGRMIVRTQSGHATLSVGDSVFFRADRPHAYEHAGDEDAVALLTMSYAGDFLPPDR